jgi:inner membrane protein
MLTQTHFFFALALGYVLKLPAKVIAVAGVIPDADMVFTQMGTAFPFIHRGFLHTPVILGVALIGIYLVTKRSDICAAFGAGFLSHLFIDTLNPTGIMWLYPLPTFFTLDLATYSNVIANYGIIAWSIAFILIFNPHIMTSLNPKNLGLKSIIKNIRSSN